MREYNDTIKMCSYHDSGSDATELGWLTIVDETLRSWFYCLGEAIGKEPGYFLIVPILLTALCGTGFQVRSYVLLLIVPEEPYMQAVALRWHQNCTSIL